jgi:hypothetical protein
MHFLYLKIPVANQGANEIHKLEDKVDELLKEAGMGSVAGWGDSLGAALPDGTRPVAYTRIDIDVWNLASATSFLQAQLPDAGAPTDTEIHYTIDHRHYKDIYSESGWLLRQLS